MSDRFTALDNKVIDAHTKREVQLQIDGNASFAASVMSMAYRQGFIDGLGEAREAYTSMAYERGFEPKVQWPAEYGRRLAALPPIS